MEGFVEITFRGKKAAVSEGRLGDRTMPFLYCYDIRHGDDWGVPLTIETQPVVVDFWGKISFVDPLELDCQDDDGKRYTVLTTEESEALAEAVTRQYT